MWRTGRPFIALTALAALAACSGPAASDPLPPIPPAASAASTPLASPTPLTDADWPTYHHDNGRTGVATGLPTVSTVAAAWQAKLDGAVYGQPLVIGSRVLAATENNTVYGLDAPTGATLWSQHVGTPVPRSKLPCGNIDPLGITSTMAYDPATQLVFALAETTDGVHTLYGIDISSGAVKLQRVAEPPKGDKLAHQQRSALTVYNGRVFIAYGGLAGDCAQYIGSVVAVPTTGDGPIRSYAIPTPREGGIWAPGGGTMVGGKLYYAVGNGESTTGFDGSDTVIALTPDLQRTDFFAPASWADDNANDLDLGSMTPAIMGSHIFIAGKRGVAYTLDAEHLGGLGGEVRQVKLCAPFGGAAVSGSTIFLPCKDGIRSATVDAAGAITEGWHGPAGAKGSPVVGGGVVWVVDYDGGLLYVLDPATGQTKGTVSIGKAPHFASPTLGAGHAYIGTLNSVVAVSIS
jgi:polyvinyl alcohol dehydrogenase (cytochrome)